MDSLQLRACVTLRVALEISVFAFQGNDKGIKRNKMLKTQESLSAVKRLGHICIGTILNAKSYGNLKLKVLPKSSLWLHTQNLISNGVIGSNY